MTGIIQTYTEYLISVYPGGYLAPMAALFAKLPGGRPVASPQNNGKKRAVASSSAEGQGEAGTHNKSDVKLAMKAAEIALSSVRRLEAVSYLTYLLPKEHALTAELKEAMDAFNGVKPATGPHPWKGSRNVAGTCVMLHCAKALKENKVGFDTAQAIWHTGDLNTHLQVVIKYCDEAAQTLFHHTSAFMDYLETRETKDGRRLLKIAFRASRVDDIFFKDTFLGRYPQDILEPLLFVLTDQRQDGPGPRGPLERDLEKALKTGRK